MLNTLIAADYQNQKIINLLSFPGETSTGTVNNTDDNLVDKPQLLILHMYYRLHKRLESSQRC